MYSFIVLIDFPLYFSGATSFMPDVGGTCFDSGRSSSPRVQYCLLMELVEFCDWEGVPIVSASGRPCCLSSSEPLSSLSCSILTSLSKLCTSILFNSISLSCMSRSWHSSTISSVGHLGTTGVSVKDVTADSSAAAAVASSSLCEMLSLLILTWVVQRVGLPP